MANTPDPFGLLAADTPAPKTDPFGLLAAEEMSGTEAVVQGAKGSFKQTVANWLTSIGSMPNPGGMMGSWSASTPIYREQKTPQEQQAQAKALFSPMAKEGEAQASAAIAAHPVLGNVGSFAGMAPAYLMPQSILAAELGAEVQHSDQITASGIGKALSKTALFSALPLAHRAAAPLLKGAEAAVGDQILARTGNLVASKVGAKLIVGTGEAAVGQEAILGGLATIDQDASMYDPTNPDAYSTRAAGLLFGGAMLSTKAVPTGFQAARAGRIGEQTVSSEAARQFEIGERDKATRLPAEAADLGVEAPGISAVPAESGTFVLRSTTGQTIGSRELPGIPAIDTPFGYRDISTGVVKRADPLPVDPDAGLRMAADAAARTREAKAELDRQKAEGDLRLRMFNDAATNTRLARAEQARMAEQTLVDRAAENDITIEAMAQKFGVDPADAVAEGRAIAHELRRQGVDPQDAADRAAIEMQKKLRGLSTPLPMDEAPRPRVNAAPIAPEFIRPTIETPVSDPRIPTQRLSESEAFPQTNLGEREFTGTRTDVPQVQVTSPNTWEGRRQAIEKMALDRATSAQDRRDRQQKYKAAQQLRQIDKRAGEEYQRFLDTQYDVAEATMAGAGIRENVAAQEATYQHIEGQGKAQQLRADEQSRQLNAGDIAAHRAKGEAVADVSDVVELSQAEPAFAKQRPVEAKPVEAKPIEAKPIEAKPIEAKPIEAKPVEAKPVEAKPVEAKAAPVEDTVVLAVRKGGKAKPTLVTPEHIEGNDSFFVVHDGTGKATLAQYVEGTKPITVTAALGNPKARAKPVIVDQGRAKAVGEPKDVKWTTAEEAKALAQTMRDEAPIARQAVKETKADATIAKKVATYDPVEAAKGVIERYEDAPIKTRADEDAHFAKEKPEDLHSFLTHGDVRDIPPELTAKIRTKEQLTPAEQAVVDEAKRVLTPHVREMVTHARDKALNRQDAGVVSKSDAINSGLNITKEQHAAGSVGEASGVRVAPELVGTLSRLVGGKAELRAPDDNTLVATMPRGGTITVIMDTEGRLPNGTLGSVRTEVRDGQTHSIIYLHREANRGVLAHEIGHIQLDHYLDPKDYKLLLSRITDAQVRKTLAKYEAVGKPVSEAKAREEAALDRLKDYENHGVLERSIWQRLQDFAKEIAKHFGLGRGSEKQIMDQMLGGEFFKRSAREADVDVQFSIPGDMPIPPGTPRSVVKRIQDIRKRLAQALRDTPMEAPLLRLQERAELATGENKAALVEMAEAGKVATTIADARLVEGQKHVLASNELNTSTSWSDLARATSVDAKVGHEVGYNSPLYDAIYEKGDSSTPVVGAAKDLVLATVKTSNGWFRESGIPASGEPPHSYGRDFFKVIGDVNIREGFYRLVAEANQRTVAEVREHWSRLRVDTTDSAISLAQAETHTKFPHLPQFYDHAGSRYEMFTVQPERLVRGIVADSAHRSAFAQVLGAGRDITVDPMEITNLSELKGLKFSSGLSAAEQGMVRDWIKVFHGSTLGPRWDMNNSYQWARKAVDVAVGLQTVAKEKALLTAAPGNVIGSLGTMSMTGVMPTAKAIGTLATSFKRSLTSTQDAGLANTLFRSTYDPNSTVMGVIAKSGNAVGVVNRLANATSDTLANIAGHAAFDAAQAAARAGKPDRTYQAMLRSMGFTRKEIVDITETGAATPQMRDEVVRRTVANATGNLTARGGAANWTNQWMVKKFGPAFTSWIDAQTKRRLRGLAGIVEGDVRSLQTFTGDILLTLGIGGINAVFWSGILGSKGTEQEMDRSTATKLFDYLWQGFGGGYINMVNQLYARGADGKLSDTVKIISYPASAAFNEAHALAEAVRALRNGEGMLTALSDYAKESTPAIQRASDALTWAVEDRSPGTLRKSLRLFAKWRADNPKLATVPFAGAASSESDTSLAINRAIRAIKQGDKVSADLAVKIGLVSAAEGKDPSKIRSAILGHRIITKLPVDTREAALRKIATDLGPVTMARLQRHDRLLEIMADIAAPKASGF